MLKSFFLFFLISLSFESYSQEKVLWSYHYDETNEELVLDAQIADGWYIYSQVINEGIGPIPTSFTYFENSDVKLIGKTIEPESIREYDENFEGELNFFKENATFKQKMKVSTSTSVKGVITYMTCNDTMCLPPKDVEFVITINKL
ncbi:MAG: protein-disulfide reductase DsbD N-terminal domain-containing protein [Crocinitomicaceae bacterium]|nr:protein-disulfide reductase DsbD N-terminal domain-containing protein [Crocinitomicaceae bacterium]